MNIGIILQSNNPEHVWNAFRFGITALNGGHTVSKFLLNEGSEIESITESEKFDITNKVSEYRSLGGKILACGTCLKNRGKEGSEVYPISTMNDLLKLIEDADKVLTF